MPSSALSSPGALQARIHRWVVVTVLGFASGLPLALTGQAMQAWLSTSGVDIAQIGFLAIVGLPYTFKFLWAPLMDRFEPPWLGRRRGWLVLTQLALAAALWLMSLQDPLQQLDRFALVAVLVAFLSASQDIVIDAYRTDVLPSAERGMGSSLNVLGYRLAMVLSGGVALIWTDVSQVGAWTWPEVYRLMAGLLAAAATVSALLLPRLPEMPRPQTVARHDLTGFAAVLLAVAVGYGISVQVMPWLASQLLSPVWGLTTLAPDLQKKWQDLLALLMGLGVSLPLAAWAARTARFETLLAGWRGFFSVPDAFKFLAFIVLYKLGDAFAGSLMTPFLLKSMAFGSAEVGVVNKLIGLWMTILGALLGGAVMLRLGLWRSLVAFGILQAVSNLGFAWLASAGKGQLGQLLIPSFDWGFVHLSHATPVDGGLLLVVVLENLSSGMGTAAFVAFLMSLCQQRFTATQFALLSAFASIGRVWVGPLAGVLAESIGWPVFFILSTVLALPALWLLKQLRPGIDAAAGQA